MCTAFSILQGLNKARMDPVKWDLMWNKGVRHMLFAIKLYRIQAEAGRFFIHEHPASASNWKLPEMQALIDDGGHELPDADQCVFDARHNKTGEHIKTPTRIIVTGNCGLEEWLQQRCR